MGTMKAVRAMVTAAPRGSTMPDKRPPRKALCLPTPAALRGMEMMAPSGRFCKAMPKDKAKAPAALIPV